MHRIGLRRAAKLQHRQREEWRTIFRDVFYDQIAGRHLVQVRITKFSGEEITITGTPSSILELASYMLRSVRPVGVRESFTAHAIELFDQEVRELYALLKPPPEDGGQPD